MNAKRKLRIEVFRTCIRAAFAALIIAFLVSTPLIVRAQNPAAEKVLYNFAPATGYSSGGLTIDGAGNLYVATSYGGANRTCFNGCGSILKIGQPSGRATTLYTFMYSGISTSGPFPSGLVRDKGGNLYTATTYGGIDDLYGSVFKVRASGSAGFLYSFQGGQDGWNPAGGLTVDAAGNLYGTTYYGGGTGCGGQGCGIVYRVAPSGSETVLYRFTGGADGRGPAAAPILDAVGNLYGTASVGGDLSCAQTQGLGCGTVWKLDSSSNLTVLYTFTGGADGALPASALLYAPDGNIYGDSLEGGNLSCSGGYGCGVVFKIDSSGNFSALYAFAGGSSDGAGPSGPLLRDTAGNLYGTTGGGGNQSCINGCGTVFKLDSSNSETLLHFFAGGTGDGWGPNSPLVTDGKGNLYGTTVLGGIGNVGVIFKVQTQ